MNDGNGNTNGRRVILRDVAERAGVSIATVSKVANGRGEVSRDTRNRVERAMADLGYFQSSPHKAGSSPLIEVAFHHFDTVWTLDIMRGIAGPTQSAGVRSVVSLLDGDDAQMAAWVEEVVARRPIGVIVVFSKPTESLGRRFASRNIPCVFIDPLGNPESGIMSVQSDNWSGGLYAGRHLLALGHRRIATITGPDNAMCANARLAGFRSAFTEFDASFDPTMVRHGEFTADSGERLARELLGGDVMRADRRPTAIFTQSDEIALGVYRAAAALDLRIPDDLSVVGFDDVRTSITLMPALTTVSQPLARMGEAAARMVMERRSPDADPRVILPTELVVRNSTAAPGVQAPSRADSLGAKALAMTS